MIEISQKPLGGKKGVILGLPLRSRQLSGTLGEAWPKN